MSQNNRQQQQQRGQTLSQLAEGKTKKVEIPELLKFLLYGTFIVCSVGAVLYSSGAWTHTGSSLDTAVSVTVGACGVFGPFILYFVIQWLETR